MTGDSVLFVEILNILLITVRIRRELKKIKE